MILSFTGLSKEIAHFQARSAFSGTGFTTKESEMIMSHPLRRKVILMLMMVRSIGFITVLSSLMLSFLSTHSTEDVLSRFLWLFGGLAFFYIFSKIKLFDILISKAVEKAMKRWTKLHVNDYESLLNLSGEYEVIECEISPGSWLANRILSELKLSEEGILVLGIKRQDGYYIGTPRPNSTIYPNDRVILYGREILLRQIGQRKTGKEGDKIHLEAVILHKKLTGEKIVLSEEAAQPASKNLIQSILNKFFNRKKAGTK